MNVILYNQMLEAVKQELAQSQKSREELETLFVIWRKRMAGSANHEAVLQEVFQVLTFHRREAHALDNLHKYLQLRLAKQDDPNFLVEFGDDGYPKNGEELFPKGSEASSKKSGKDKKPLPAKTAPEPKEVYPFGPKGFTLDRQSKASSRETGEEDAEETQTQFTEKKDGDTLLFGPTGRLLPEFLNGQHRQANVNATV
jgi:hypothetical protein